MPWLQTYCSAMHCGGAVCSGMRGRQVSENHMIIVIYIYIVIIIVIIIECYRYMLSCFLRCGFPGPRDIRRKACRLPS